MPQFHFSTSSCLKSIAVQAMWYWAKQTNARKLVGAKMKKILLIESSPRGNDSYSHHAARSIVNELQRRNPGAKRTVLGFIGITDVEGCASNPWRTVPSVRKRRWLRPAHNQSTSWPNSHKQ
jgi:endo-alpha-1,4-polygalactosaminidase (GH114 family)